MAVRRSGFKKKINRENNNSLDVVSSCSPRTSLAGRSRGGNFTASAASSEQPPAQPRRAESKLDFGSHVAGPGLAGLRHCATESPRLDPGCLHGPSIMCPRTGPFHSVSSWCEIEADYSNSASCAGGVGESEVATPKTLGGVSSQESSMLVNRQLTMGWAVLKEPLFLPKSLWSHKGSRLCKGQKLDLGTREEGA